MRAGVPASLSYATTNSRMLLKNFYQKGLNNIKKGTDDKPKAFIIPKNQRDPAMAAYLVNQLQALAIDVQKAESGKIRVIMWCSLMKKTTHIHHYCKRASTSFNQSILR